MVREQREEGAVGACKVEEAEEEQGGGQEEAQEAGCWEAETKCGTAHDVRGRWL